jgi:hypothetical protein
MEKLERMLKQVEEMGDLRRKEARLLEDWVCQLCDQIGEVSQKAGVWGKHMHVFLGSADEDFYTGKFLIAYLTSVEVFVDAASPPVKKVVVRLAEAWESEQYDGWTSLEIEPYHEYWTHHKNVYHDVKPLISTPIIKQFREKYPNAKKGDEVQWDGDPFFVREIVGNISVVHLSYYHIRDYAYPSRQLTVKLAHKLEELAQKLLDRCKQLAEENQEARKKVESIDLPS